MFEFFKETYVLKVHVVTDFVFTLIIVKFFIFKGERSVLDKDPVATQLLEMAGKKTYSRGFRDE